MKGIPFFLPLTLTLAACAPAVIRTEDARLTATARTPGGVYTFDCNPALNARQNGAALFLGGDTSVSCPSTDGRATLALSFSTVTSPPPVAPVPLRPVPVRVRPVPVQPTPETPGRAILSPAPPSVPAPSPPTTETRLQVLLVVPGTVGTAPLTSSGQTRQTSLSQWNLPWSQGLRGDFRADLGGGVSVEGRFNLVGE